MSKMRLLLFLLIPGYFLYSQSSETISVLKREISKSTPDSNRIKIFGDLCWEYLPIQLDSSLKYGLLELKLSQQLNRKADEAQSLSDLGSVYNRAAKYDSALVYYQQALKIRSQLGHSEKMAGIYSNMATVYTRLAKYKEAIEINFKALKVFELLNQPEKMGNVLGNIGTLFSDLKDNTNGQKYFHKALSLAKQTNAERLIASCLLHLGALKLDAQDQDSSVYYFRESMKIYSKLEDAYGLGTLFNNLGTIHYRAGKSDSAIYYFEKALKIKEESGDSYGTGLTHLYLGQTYKLKNKKDKALFHLEASVVALKQLGNYLNLIDAYTSLAEIYEESNNPSKSLAYFKIVQLYKDSIFSEAQQRTLAEMKTKYETEKQENEIKLNEEKLRAKENRFQFIIALGASLFLFAGILSYLYYVRYKRKQKELRERSVLEAKDKERTRIARELHDNIGSTVSFITTKADTLIGKVGENEELRNALNEVKETSSNVMSGLRDTIWTLNKKEISNFELADKLKTYVKKHSVIATAFDDQMINEHFTDGDKVLHLFRASQEIINNCNKHSKAKKIKIVFRESDSFFIEIDFNDDGIGFNPEECMNKTGHYGLKNLQSRMNDLGAELKINSSPGMGTQIICRLACNSA